MIEGRLSPSLIAVMEIQPKKQEAADKGKHKDYNQLDVSLLLWLFYLKLQTSSLCSYINSGGLHQSGCCEVLENRRQDATWHRVETFFSYPLHWN